MIRVKQNFKNQHENHLCQLCKTENEDQMHLFMCEKILQNCPELATNVEVEYEDIFGPKAKQIEVAKLFVKILEMREKLINETEL